MLNVETFVDGRGSGKGAERYHHCKSFINVDIVSLFVCNLCVAPTFVFEWGRKKKVLDTYNH